jgi:hypothetical protein
VVGTGFKAALAKLHAVALCKEGRLAPMLHKKDGKNLTDGYGPRVKDESEFFFGNSPTVHSRIGSIFLHLFYPPGKPENSRSGVAKGLQ